MSTNENWVAAYYPFEMVSSQHSKTILCLLFDKIICHFPVADFVCGGGHGMSEVLFGDSPLVEAGVIELREETILADIPCNFSPGFYWGTEKESDLYRRLQVTSMSLNDSVLSGSVPLTDIADSPVPATILEKIDFKRFARLQASALAVQSLKIGLPALKEISDEEILEAREQLKEQLIFFRNAMLMLSPAVRHSIENNHPVSEIHKEAQYIVETSISPALQELRKKLESEKGKFWRRIVLQGSSIVPNFFLNWTTKNALSAAIDAVAKTKDIALNLIDREEAFESFKMQGGLGYFLDIVEHPIFKNAD